MQAASDVAFIGGAISKSGLPAEGLDRQKIDEIIREASKGSKFYQFQLKREDRIKERVRQLQLKKEAITVEVFERTEKEVKRWIEEQEATRQLDRIYVHIDMDAFFAAVEALKRPELADVPMAVGGESMLSTANYAARKFGVSAAMPGYIARKLCPHLIIVPSDYEAYKSSSEKVRKVLARYDPNFSSFSLDEASLDITDYILSCSQPSQPESQGESEAERIVRQLRAEVLAESQLTCSAGIAPNRQLAKMCSNQNKPNGQFSLPANPEKILSFLAGQPAKRISGIGKVTAKVLQDLLGISTCKDIIQQASWIRLLFSEIQADFLLRSALGLGAAFGEGYSSASADRKSMSVERTFKPLKDLLAMRSMLESLCEMLAADLDDEDVCGKTVGIKLKCSSFDTITRAITVGRYVHTKEDLFRYASELLIKNQPKDVRLMGVRLSALAPRDEVEQVKTLDAFLSQKESDNGEAESHPMCPICNQVIACQAQNLLRVNQHIEECLRKIEGISSAKIQEDPPKKKIKSITTTSSTSSLDRFLTNRK